MNLPILPNSPPAPPSSAVTSPVGLAPRAPARGWSERWSRLKHHVRILLGARTRDQALTGPLYVQVGVADACNYRCQFCWDHPSYVEDGSPYPDDIARIYYASQPDRYDRTHMTWEMFTPLVDDLHALGTRKLKFIGRGESFLNRRFVDMVQYAKRKRFNCTVTTNGSLMKREDIRTLVRAGLNELFVSINAASPTVYNEVHLGTKPGAFEKVTAATAAVAEEKARARTHRPFVNASFVIQKNNYHQIPDMVRLAHAVGAQRVLFNYIYAYEGTQFLVPTTADNTRIDRELLPEAERLAAEYGLEVNASLFRDRFIAPSQWKAIHQKVPCYVGWYFAIVLADGTVNPCCQCLRTVGSLNTQRFRDIWYGALYQTFRAEASDLVTRQQEVPGCHCYDCGMAPHNLTMHRVLHPLSAAGNGHARFGLRDLRRFIGR